MSHRILQLSVSKVEGDEELLEACLYFSNVCYWQKPDCTGLLSKPAHRSCLSQHASKVFACLLAISGLQCHVEMPCFTAAPLLCHARSGMLENACMQRHQLESCIYGLMPDAVIHILADASFDVMQHAPVADSNAAFPLVIFSHGIGGNRMAYSAIICSLVRQVSVT